MTVISCMVPEIWSATDKIFCHFGQLFALLPPLATQKIKILKKMEKLPGDIIILHRCNINDNHIMYGSWDTKRIRQTFLPFWTIFCTFTPLTTRKIKSLKKNEKTTWRYYHFAYVYHKWQSYDVWFLRYGAWRTEFFVILDYFCPFTPLTNQKLKILKQWKNLLEILSFYTSLP